MQEYLAKLVSLLEHKLFLLDELIGGQERFQQFLEQPDRLNWVEVTHPQEELLVKLRQVQAAQDYLLGELARVLRVKKIQNLKALCGLIEPEWQRALLDSIEKIGAAVMRLKVLTRRNAALNQAEWRFNRDWLSKGQPAPSTSVYNSQGYARQTAFTHHCVSREV